MPIENQHIQAYAYNKRTTKSTKKYSTSQKLYYCTISSSDCLNLVTVHETLGYSHVKVKRLKLKGHDTCYSAAYMSQTQEQHHFTISEVAADWHIAAHELDNIIRLLIRYRLSPPPQKMINNNTVGPF